MYRRYSPAVFLFLFLTSNLLGQTRAPETAWEELLLDDPSSVDDRAISWRDRLILHVLSPEQARSYYGGASEDSLILEDGQTLSEYLAERLAPPGSVYVSLPAPCLLFRLDDISSETVVSLQTSSKDLTPQGGAESGCPIPESTTAVLLQLQADVATGEGVRFKLWAADGPEPAGAVLETGYSRELRQATAIIPVCREDDCPGGNLKARLEQDTAIRAEVLGYFRPAAVGDYPGERLPFAFVGNNTYDGDSSLNGNTGVYTTGYGFWTLSNGNSGDGNTAVGAKALVKNTTAGNNSALGYQALANNTTGGVNTAVGAWALNKNVDGGANTAIGQGSLSENVSGNHNTALGHHALQANTTVETSPGSGVWRSGDDNTAVGYDALTLNETGYSNTAAGKNAGHNNTTGGNNAFFGVSAGYGNTTGCCNSYFGKNAGSSGTTQNSNSYFGYLAGSRATGKENSFFGREAGYGGDEEDFNDGDYNSFFGYAAGYLSIWSQHNSFVGHSAGWSNSYGDDNTFVGNRAGYSNFAGDGNSLLGSLTDLANGPDPWLDAVNNASAVGYRAYVSQSNSLVLGSIDGVNGATKSVDVGIGVAAPLASLHVHRGDGTARLLIEDQAPTVAVRTQFQLKNNGAPRFALENSSSGIEWSFQQSGPGNFLISKEGTGGPEMQVYTNGRVRMGPGGTINFDLSPSGNLTIAGSLTANGSTFPDYVFEPDYPLLPLEKLGDFIQTEKRLPNIPSAVEVKKQGGHNMTELQIKLLEKIEELTLYTLEQEKRLQKVERENAQLRSRIIGVEGLLKESVARP